MIKRLNSRNFRRLRILPALILMIPSFIIDMILIYRIVTMHPVVMNRYGGIDIPQILMLFVFNFLILKSEGLCYYYILKYNRKRSEVRVSKDEVVYRKRRIVGYEFYYNYKIFVEFHITEIHCLLRRKNGSIVIKGNIKAVYFHLDGEQILGEKKVKWCVIPGYFEDMEKIYEKLKEIEGNLNGKNT